MSISFFGFRCMCIAPQSLGDCPEGTWIYAVRMAKGDDSQLFSFKVERLPFEDLRRRQLRRDLARKARLPEGFYKVGVYLFLHSGNT